MDFESKGINHTEGGWPKDVNFLDVEQVATFGDIVCAFIFIYFQQTVRYRRKIEKDENYINQVMGMSKVSKMKNEK